MNEKDQSKRGILASLLGLFGEEEEGSDKQTGFESLERAPSAWPQETAEPPAEAGETAGECAPSHESPAEPAFPAPEERPVVRESYEPGWYAVSASQWPPAEESHEEIPQAAEPSSRVEAESSAPSEAVKRFVPGDPIGSNGPGAVQMPAAPVSPIEPVAVPQPIEHQAGAGVEAPGVPDTPEAPEAPA